MKNSLEQENNFLKEMIRTYYQPEIDNLQQRIDKAIEYIEENWRKSILLGTWEFYGSGEELIEILRGEDNVR